MHIVLIPGLANDGWVWRGQLGPLSRHGCVTVACNDGCSSLGEMAERLLTRTEGELCLVGHSMGGRVALEVLARAPERVKKLVLLDTGAGPRTEEEAAGRLALVDLARSKGMKAMADAWLPPMLSAASRADDDLSAGITAMIERCDPEHFALQQRALLERLDRRPLLAGITCPTLLAAGSEDAWSPPSRHIEMAQLIPDARFNEIAGAGHMTPVEAPEQISELLVTFCKE